MPPEDGAAVGSKVGVRFGGRIVLGVVIEDRGVLGGKRIVRVHIGDSNDPEEPEFEVPVEELVPAPAAA